MEILITLAVLTGFILWIQSIMIIICIVSDYNKYSLKCFIPIYGIKHLIKEYFTC